MTRVIHTGDTHLGYQQYHVPERRRDFLAAFRQVVDDAVADDVDAVVHAGDLFHDRRPTLSDIMGTLDVLRNLDDADIPSWPSWATTRPSATPSGSTCSNRSASPRDSATTPR